MKESWKQIPGYEGIYEASNTGMIRTVEGKTTSNKRFSKRIWKQRVLKQKIQKRSYSSGDAIVCLWKDGKERKWLVARLVAMAWCNGYKNGLTVNHINGNSLDNRATNLEWVSLGDNIRHAFENGLNTCARKVVLINRQSGEQKSFYSCARASVWLGRNNGYVSDALKKGKCISDINGNRYVAYREGDNLA